MQHANSEPTEGQKNRGNSTSKQFKLVCKGNKVYRWPINRDKGINTQDAYQPYSPVVNKGENNPKAGAQAMSSSSSFKKGINCFNCSYEGHYAHECRKPKQQDGGNTPKARLNALEVHESDLDDIRESDGDHPNTEE